ncbi:sensor histidine kinase [Desulfobacterota bacterium M19]
MDRKNEAADLGVILQRTREKRADYINYNFSPRKNDALKTFFDLAQEFDSLTDFFKICVAVPREFFEVDTRLYFLNNEQRLELVCDTIHGVYAVPPVGEQYVRLALRPYISGQSYLIPIYSTVPLEADMESESDKSKIIGVFEITPVDELTEDDKFFFCKYANRIGYNLRKKILAHQNIQHLKFINNLVNDIEHNVIIPNMHYRYLFKQLERHINSLNDLTSLMEQYRQKNGGNNQRCEIIISKIKDIKNRLNASYSDISRHHVNSSLFLESLLRRDHFEKGCFVLRRQICKLDSEIITPQLENYAKRMAMRGITIETPKDMRGEEIELNADLGLLSQVYANLFSNALKYTQRVERHNGHSRKAVAYGRRIIKDYFGAGQPGIKLNVFSTGEHIPTHEIASLFDDGFTGHNQVEDLSRGHGLAFIKYVVEMHGGRVGYEPTAEGNNFYFILPLLQSESKS